MACHHPTRIQMRSWRCLCALGLEAPALAIREGPGLTVAHNYFFASFASLATRSNAFLGGLCGLSGPSYSASLGEFGEAALQEPALGLLARELERPLVGSA